MHTRRQLHVKRHTPHPRRVLRVQLRTKRILNRTRIIISHEILTLPVVNIVKRHTLLPLQLRTPVRQHSIVTTNTRNILIIIAHQLLTPYLNTRLRTPRLNPHEMTRRTIVHSRRNTTADPVTAVKIRPTHTNPHIVVPQLNLNIRKRPPTHRHHRLKQQIVRHLSRKHLRLQLNTTNRLQHINTPILETHSTVKQLTPTRNRTHTENNPLPPVRQRNNQPAILKTILANLPANHHRTIRKPHAIRQKRHHQLHVTHTTSQLRQEIQHRTHLRRTTQRNLSPGSLQLRTSRRRVNNLLQIQLRNNIVQHRRHLTQSNNSLTTHIVNTLPQTKQTKLRNTAHTNQQTTPAHRHNNITTRTQTTKHNRRTLILAHTHSNTVTVKQQTHHTSILRRQKPPHQHTTLNNPQQ